jgi:hypothetical protein
MMGFDGYDISPGMWILTGLMMVIAIGALLALVVLVARGFSGRPSGGSNGARASQAAPGRGQGTQPIKGRECSEKRESIALQSRSAAHSRPRRPRRSKVERETGSEAPSTNHPVQFIYRLG